MSIKDRMRTLGLGPPVRPADAPKMPAPPIVALPASIAPGPKQARKQASPVVKQASVSKQALGGIARAAALSRERRVEIGRAAAEKRWGRSA